MIILLIGFLYLLTSYTFSEGEVKRIDDVNQGLKTILILYKYV